MQTNYNSSDILKGLVEKVVFDKDRLDLLKQKIVQLTRNEITQKEMKELILNQRAMILDEILELFPFFIKNLNDNNHITRSVDDKRILVDEELQDRLYHYIDSFPYRIIHNFQRNQ